VGTTSKYGLPYPALSDIPSGPVAVQNLATAVDALGVIGGKRLTSAGSAISTIEAVVVDTQTLALPASSVFLIEYFLTFTASAIPTNDVDMKIRLTSVSGTILAETSAVAGYATPTPCHGFLRLVYKTTTAELDYFCGTAIHIGAGAGTITPVQPCSIIVTNIGPSTIVGDY
jgi:hypothetical protein